MSNLKTTAEAVLAAGEKADVGCKCDNRGFDFTTCSNHTGFNNIAGNSIESLAQGYLNLLKKYEVLEEALELIADKMPQCECVDGHGMAKDALDEAGAVGE